MPAKRNPIKDITHRELMLPGSSSKPFDRPGWLYELNYDGVRVLAVHQGKEVRLLSRSGRDLAPSFPEIAEDLAALPDVVLDAELMILDKRGKPELGRLRRRASLTRESAVRNASLWEPAALLVFDILVFRRTDVRGLPLLKRKEIAKTVLFKSVGAFGRTRLVQHVGEGASGLFEAASALQLEGIIAKRADAPYSAGRSRDWLKIRTPHGRHSK